MWFYTAGRRRDGLSIRSSNFYLQAIKQFCRWLVADHRTAENPLAYLSGQNPKTDIRHARRALSVDELNALIEKATEAPEHSCMTGRERAMLYTLAVSTGLRASELVSLTWQSFNLSGPAPSVTVLAAYSKHRRDDVQPLRADMARLLAQWKAEQDTDEQSKVFGHFSVNKAAKMLRKDLEAAGIAYRDGAGRVVDFHSLRHTFISNLTRSGVSPKIAQALARHSTIGLTIDTYTHIGLHDERAALDSLPELPGSAENKAVALKTGTDNLPVESSKSAYKPAYKKLTKNAFLTSAKLAVPDTERKKSRETGPSDKSINGRALGIKSEQLSLTDTRKNDRRRWDSNPRITVLQTVAFGHLATPPAQLKSIRSLPVLQQKMRFASALSISSAGS